MAKAILTSPVFGPKSRLVRLKIEPASKVFGGATGAMWTMRPFLPERAMRSSSGIGFTPLARSETLPMPGATTPEPENEAVFMSASPNGISAAWTEPAADFSTKALQRVR